MSKCIKIAKKKRKVCIGGMDKLITLKIREIKSPLFNTVDFQEEFTDIATNPEVYAMFETVNGKTYFDGVNTETPITHYIYIYFNEEVTSETWIDFETRRIDILRVQDFEDEHEFMKLTCVDRGLLSKEATKK